MENQLELLNCAPRLRLTSPFSALPKLRWCTSSVYRFQKYRKMFVNQHGGVKMTTYSHDMTSPGKWTHASAQKFFK